MTIEKVVQQFKQGRFEAKEFYRDFTKDYQKLTDLVLPLPTPEATSLNKLEETPLPQPYKKEKNRTEQAAYFAGFLSGPKGWYCALITLRFLFSEEGKGGTAIDLDDEENWPNHKVPHQ